MAGSDVSGSIFSLDRSSRAALQAQIRQTVVSAVLSGDLTPGSRLPSTRRLSAYLNVSRITVWLAYQELVSQGYLEANERSGYRISMSGPVARLRSRPEAQTAIDWPGRLRTRFSAFRRVRKPLDWRSYPFPFLYGQTGMSLFDLGAGATVRAGLMPDWTSISWRAILRRRRYAACQLHLLAHLAAARHHRESG
jgi:GntR family transcriptional regulator / MocR family aminotransferase